MVELRKGVEKAQNRSGQTIVNPEANQQFIKLQEDKKDKELKGIIRVLIAETMRPNLKRNVISGLFPRNRPSHKADQG